MLSSAKACTSPLRLARMFSKGPNEKFESTISQFANTRRKMHTLNVIHHFIFRRRMTKRKALAFLTACSSYDLTEVTTVLWLKLPGQDLPLQRSIKLGWNQLWLKYYHWRYLIWTDLTSQIEFGSLLLQETQRIMEKVFYFNERGCTIQTTCRQPSPNTPS